MTVKERYDGIIGWFRNEMPEPKTELHYETPFQLLVAVILSAQCTDKRKHRHTSAVRGIPHCRSHGPGHRGYTFSIRQIGVIPQQQDPFVARYGPAAHRGVRGEVPADIDALLSLPGVGRKTANVILSVVFGKSAMAVDTHVFRVSERIGLTTGSKSPLATEQCLCEAYTGRSDRQGTPLAHTPWPLRVQARRPSALNAASGNGVGTGRKTENHEFPTVATHRHTASFCAMPSPA